MNLGRFAFLFTIVYTHPTILDLISWLRTLCVQTPRGLLLNYTKIRFLTGFDDDWYSIEAKNDELEVYFSASLLH